MVQRYGHAFGFDAFEMVPQDDGAYVKHTDHASALDAVKLGGDA